MTLRSPIRVLLVDDHTVVRSGLAAVLAVSDDLVLVGEASDGDEAIRQCEKLKPQVVLMDLLMPNMDGVAATEAIHGRWPDVRIIALTSFKEKEYVEGALKAGAISYLLKNVSAEELVMAVRRSVAGQSSLSPEAAQVLVRSVHDPGELGHDLTDRERDTLRLMVDGLSNAEIADHLVVSLSTVKFHVSNILSKLGAGSRTEAVALAMKHHVAK